MRYQKKLLRTGNGVILGVELKISAADLFFLDPAATHVTIDIHPTQNGVIAEITGAEGVK